MEDAVFGADNQVREKCQQIIRELASTLGIFLASIQGLYEAAGKGLYDGITVPAINIRGITYQVARAVFRAALKDRVGALHDVLVPFKRSNINLTKIESRPSKKKPWKYYFFVDLQSHIENKAAKQALRGLQRHCIYLKVLGSYPAAKD